MRVRASWVCAGVAALGTVVAFTGALLPYSLVDDGRGNLPAELAPVASDLYTRAQRCRENPIARIFEARTRLETVTLVPGAQCGGEPAYRATFRKYGWFLRDLGFVYLTCGSSVCAGRGSNARPPWEP